MSHSVFLDSEIYKTYTFILLVNCILLKIEAFLNVVKTGLYYFEVSNIEQGVRVASGVFSLWKKAYKH